MKPANHPPREDVLLELGRLTWEAIGLESEVYFVCQALKPSSSPTGKPVSARVKEARMALRQIADDAVRADVDAWLGEAVAVLQERNAVLHSMPMVFEAGGEARPEVLGWLAHQPRDPDAPDRYISLSVEHLSKIRLKLEAARRGFGAVGGSVFQAPLGSPPAS